MGKWWGKLSGILEISRSAAILFLLAALIGTGLFVGFCALAGAMTYANVRLKVETVTRSALRRLPFPRAAA